MHARYAHAGTHARTQVLYHVVATITAGADATPPADSAAHAAHATPPSGLGAGEWRLPEAAAGAAGGAAAGAGAAGGRGGPGGAAGGQVAHCVVRVTVLQHTSSVPPGHKVKIGQLI
jgi:hypothetical protein